MRTIDKVNWLPSIETCIQEAQEPNKLVFLDFFSPT